LKKEFGLGEDDPSDEEALANKPDDYKDIFKGNIDDCFRIGIAWTRKVGKGLP